MPIPPDDPSPFTVIVTATVLAAFAGVASALRSTVVLTHRYVGASVLTSALSGLVICLICHNYIREQSNVYVLLGISVLAGYGGASIIDTMLGVLMRAIGRFDPATGKIERGETRYQRPPSDEAKK